MPKKNDLPGTQRVALYKGHYKKVFTVLATNFKKPKKDKLKAVAVHTILRRPRSYGSDRLSQSLRHLATAAKVYLDKNKITDYQEVQAGVDKRGNFIVSTNTNQANEVLRKFFKSKTLEDFADFVKSNRFESQEDPDNEPDTHARESRHVKKFVNSKRLQAAFGNIKGTIRVPADVKAAEDGLHAELRIRDEGKADIDVKRIKGIKRPCGHCFEELGLTADATTGPGPGPAWNSGAANRKKGKPSNAVTRLTETLGGETTFAYDTESDSDSEGGPIAKKALATKPAAKTSVLSAPKDLARDSVLG